MEQLEHKKRERSPIVVIRKVALQTSFSVLNDAVQDGGGVDIN